MKHSNDPLGNKQIVEVIFKEPASEQLKLGEVPMGTYFKFAEQEDPNSLFLTQKWPEEWKYGDKLNNILCISIDGKRLIVFNANDIVEIPKRVTITHY